MLLSSFIHSVQLAFILIFVINLTYELVKYENAEVSVTYKAHTHTCIYMFTYKLFIRCVLYIYIELGEALK